MTRCDNKCEKARVTSSRLLRDSSGARYSLSGVILHQEWLRVKDDVGVLRVPLSV
jgi:hypothetical protein